MILPTNQHTTQAHQIMITARASLSNHNDCTSKTHEDISDCTGCIQMYPHIRAVSTPYTLVICHIRVS